MAFIKVNITPQIMGVSKNFFAFLIFWWHLQACQISLKYKILGVPISSFDMEWPAREMSKPSQDAASL